MAGGEPGATPAQVHETSTRFSRSLLLSAPHSSPSTSQQTRIKVSAVWLIFRPLPWDQLLPHPLDVDLRPEQHMMPILLQAWHEAKYKLLISHAS